MRRIVITMRLLAVWMTAILFFASCSRGGDDVSYLLPDYQGEQGNNGATGNKGDKGDKGGNERMIYDGEWTVNKQVVDTARIELDDKMTLRLPEDFLIRLCFPDKSGEATPQPKGQTMEIFFSRQGYSSQTELYYFIPCYVDNNEDEFHYSSGYFYVTIDGTNYRIDLLCSETGNMIFRRDTLQWTVGISFKKILVTNMSTNWKVKYPLIDTVTIYYNTKQRIK